MNNYQHIFEPLQVKMMTLKNRIVMHQWVLTSEGNMVNLMKTTLAIMNNEQMAAQG